MAENLVVRVEAHVLGADPFVARLSAPARPGLSFDVALHGSTAAMHDYHVKSEGSFEATLRGLEAAGRALVPFAVTTAVTRSNFRHLVEIVELASRLGARAIQFAGIEALRPAPEDEARLSAPPALVVPHLARAANRARKAGLGVVAAAVAEPPSARALFADDARETGT